MALGIGKPALVSNGYPGDMTFSYTEECLMLKHECDAPYLETRRMKIHNKRVGYYRLDNAH
ncbi:MAG: hypothetical protein CVV06_17655 [Gammaproteobacteria bacterium HGW-Gammaproteobacteria-10]|nr:MAG: hypothetical protein CVV06_17655 [Gammaproteobacteria bacterium HGW-Gammaproteobacteria-10]